MTVKSVSGWITPKNRFIECPRYRHMQKILGNQECLSIDGLDKIWQKVRDAEESCEESASRGEHPEWHIYEMAKDDATYQIYNLLLKNGFIRVGTDRDAVCFEGLPEVLKAKHRRAVELAEKHGKVARFEPKGQPHG